MSRALNIDATIAEVMAMARKHDIAISAIEALEPEGTRVVMVTGDAAGLMRRAFGRRVLTGAVTRAPWRQADRGLSSLFLTLRCRTKEHPCN